MQKVIQNYLERFQQDKQRRRRLVSVFLVLALAVAVGVTWSLKMDGIAVTNTAYCGEEEHTHSDACYTTELVCGMEEGEGHTHSDSCYETNSALSCEKEEHTHSDGCYTTERVLTCDQEEGEDHQHSDSCYTEEKTLTCGKEEHSHSGSCYTEEKTLVCGKEESDGHTHSDSCYESVLTCGMEEHTHSTDCYSDESADTETASDWEKTLPSLSDSMNEDVARVAESQLGYTESTANFVLADDGETRRGYTRYGAWYGNEYGDWDAMFASFCLYYAGCTKNVVPYASGSYSWVTELKDAGLYQTASEAEPAVGDLVFFDENGDGKADACGIVTKATGSKITAVRGDYEQDGADKVVSKSYSLSDGDILGYGVLPQDEDGETDPADGDEQLMTASEEDLEAAAESSSSSSTSTGTDLTPYITGLTIQRLDGNSWVTDSDFTDGDSISLDFTLEFGLGVVTANNKTFTYTLPSSISLSGSMSGHVYFGGEDVGTYTIDSTTNEVTIDFYSSFATGNQMKGGLYLSGEVALTNKGSSANFSFPTSGGDVTITVEPKQSVGGLVTSKSSAVDNGNGTITYTVKVENTGSATSQDVTIKDTLGSSSAKYKTTTGGHAQVTVTKTAADGTTSSYNLSGGSVSDSKKAQISTDSSGNQSFTISGMDALEPGEYYTIQYTVDVAKNNGTSGYLAFNNTVDANGSSASSWTQYRDTVVNKSGSYDSDNGVINWTVNIYPQGEQITNITDTLSTEASNITVTVDGTTTQYSSWSAMTAALSNTNTASASTITITYTTGTDSKDTSNNVANEVKVEDDDGENFTGTATVPVTNRQWGVTKGNTGNTAGETVANGNETRALTWESKLTISNEDSLSNLGTFTYTDTILDSNGNVDATKHYGTVADIEAMLKDTMTLTYVGSGTSGTATGDNLSNYLTYTVTYYNGTDVITSGEVTKFTIDFTPNTSLDSTIKGKEIVFYYPTVGIVKDVTETAQVWKNQGDFQGNTVTAQASYTKPAMIGKTASSTGWEDVAEYNSAANSDGWINGSGQYSPVDSGGTITVGSDGYVYYRVVVRATTNTEEIKIEDTLPDGVDLVEESVFARYGSINWTGKLSEITSTWNKSGSYDLSEANITATQNGTDLTITIPAGSYEGNSSNAIVVFYAVKLSDTQLATLSKTTLSLTNTAEWDNNTAATTNPVEKENIVVQKKGVASDGEATYTVILNSNGANLDKDSNELTLTDTLTLGNMQNATLKSLTLYYYNGYDFTDGANNSALEVPSTIYSVGYDSSSSTKRVLTVTIPDEQGFVLSYTYSFDTGNQERVAVSNEAELAGKSDEVSSLQIQKTASGAYIQKTLDIYKVDSEDITKKLDATFALEKYDATAKTWVEVKKPISTSGTDTAIHFDTANTGEDKTLTINATLKENTLYRLVETKAPTGYAKPTGGDEYYYFIWLSKGTTWSTSTSSEAANLTNLWNNTVKNYGVAFDKINVVSYTGGDLYISNTSESISVTKVWEDSDGKVTSAPSTSIEVQLYRSYDIFNGYTVNVVSAANSGEGFSTITAYADKNSTLTLKNNDGNMDLTVVSDQGSQWTVPKGGTQSITVTSNMTLTVSSSWNYEKLVSVSTTATDYERKKEKYGEEQTLSSANSWTYTWANSDTFSLPSADSSGNPYYYTVEEVEVPTGYKVSYMNNDGIQTGSITITNRENETPKSDTTSIEVKKVWQDANGNDVTSSTTNDPISFDLYRVTDGVQPGENIGTYTISKDGGWTYTVPNLLKEETKDGVTHTYKYYVEEENVPTGYTVSYDNNDGINDDSTITITNRENETSTSETTSITVKKVWQDANGYDVTSSTTNDPISFYLYQVTDNAKPGKNIGTYTISKADGWTFTVPNLLKEETKDGVTHTYKYYVEEENVPTGYTVSYNNNDGINDGSTITITNQALPTTSIEVKKVWKDANGTNVTSTMTTGSISFDLYQVDTPKDGTATAKIYTEDLTVSAAKNWTTTVDDLPMEETKDGVEHTYTYYVEETAVEGYDTSYDRGGSAADTVNSGTITITNKLSSKSYTLPKSGGIGTGPLTAGGLLLCAGALLLARTRRRRGEAR